MCWRVVITTGHSPREQPVLGFDTLGRLKVSIATTEENALLLSVLSMLGCGATPSTPTEPPEPPLHSPVGDWAGDIQLPNNAGMPIVFHIAEGEAGALEGTVDSPMQGSTGIPIKSVYASGDTLTIEVESVRASFTGRYTDENTIEGTWKQSIAKLPLVIVRDAEVEAPNRPQTPQAPFPYSSEDLTVASNDHILAGTLTVPQGDGPFPGVVLITGSGPQDRDETLLNHKPFWVIADHLSRNGIAVFRYDDRGVGESTGDFASATSADFAEDAAAALAMLKARSEISTAGLLGHSEGGMIAPMIAERSAADFLVLLAPPAVPIQELMLAQHAAVSRSSGADQALIDSTQPIQQELFALVAQGDSPENRAAAETLIRGAPTAESLSDEVLAAQVNNLFSPWMIWFLQHDPTPALAGLQVPIYALWGGLDVQVLAEQNAPAFSSATEANAGAKAEVFAGLNHLFQPAETGSVSEYAEIETTIDETVLAAVTSWIQGL